MKRARRSTAGEAPQTTKTPAKGAATMSDVAVRAGCARSTVSMALRNDPRIPLETRSRVQQAAAALEYRTNPLVAALMTTRRMQRVPVDHAVLALVTTHSRSDPARSYPGYLSFVEGARARAAELGYRLEEFPLRQNGMTPRRLVEILRARNIHGALIAPLPRDEKHVDLDCRGLAVVGLGTSVVSPVVERVSNDHFQSMMLAMAMCRRSGYARVGFVVSRLTSERLDDRWLSGYLLASSRYPVEQRLEPLLCETPEDISGALAGWCERERPEVVVFGNFDPAKPFRLPPGVGVVVLDVPAIDGDWTGIFQDDLRVGAIGVEHVVSRIQRGAFGEDDKARLHLLAGQWVRGKTALGPQR
jgi:LacI family transcriptional regulator